ncbi:MAG: sigma-70 family RNA polymerase sigma factor [Oscillospiraceae bacterium]
MPRVSFDVTKLSVPDESKEAALIDRLALRQCLNALSDEDRALIIMRFFRNKTQAETAKLLGYTQVGVSRRERKILEELREKLI